MISDQEMKSFCMSKGTFSIPLIQLAFGVTYKEAARIVDELVGAGDASPLSDGLSYEYVLHEDEDPSTVREDSRISDDPESVEIVNGYRRFLQRFIAEQEDCIECDEREADDDEEERRSREYREKRSRELRALFEEGLDEKDIDDGHDVPAGNDKNDAGAHPVFVRREDEVLHEKLCGLLIEEDQDSKLAVAALRLCLSEGYVSSELLCKTLGIERDAAEFTCFWLYINDFIQIDDADEDRYLPVVSESLFSACCHEMEKYKSSFVHPPNDVYELQFRKIVHDKLVALVCTDLKMTRAKAITKIEGCLFAARDMGNENAIAVYENVLHELKNMSDHMFKRLKTQRKD